MRTRTYMRSIIVTRTRAPTHPASPTLISTGTIG